MVEYENGKHKIFHLHNKSWIHYIGYPILCGILGGSLTQSNRGAFAGIIISLLFALNSYSSENRYINHINNVYDVLNATEAGEEPSWSSIENFTGTF